MPIYDRNDKKPRRKRARKSIVQWNDVNADVIGDFTRFMVGDGRAVLFGSSGDDSLLSVTVYDDGQKERYYIRATADVVAELGEILEDFDILDSGDFVGRFRAPRTAENDENVSTPETAKKTR